LPFASKDKMGDYVSELLVRSNELKLKIAENEKTIDYLQGGRSAVRESRLYGTGGRIEALKIENKMNANKLAQVQLSIGRLKQQMKRLPFAMQMVEDLKKKSEIEFAKYKELSAALSKVEAQKLSLGSRFDIMERGRWDSSGPLIGLVPLLLLSLIVSQVLGSVWIYVKFLWNPQEISASRDRIIFEGHSLDPRVIIENSKIKFKIRGFRSYEDEANDLLEKLNSADA
jgi:predicted amino acid-binding ACT domain protein